ncbi:hypothetical protein CAOG_01770 [Capsaspora owczarzaki ATCC 30864]|uniref:Uncharacterized protein n=1 Tax=Capsaspora owczarzaki (strain ATCC 30864) TaxID=595528 RepID=A0A0D2X1A3_CAPO3|nr:hypothetical protein CAOG_01770 [Capsaspora owczarzaki ATCC 30864]KJE90459.1 hypothetical protein CAOG_001770 [Capsaspora owczarzaki ATCC 30864]|eukprot:XP_004364638.1 hypothetical protein CAOG_01770 [Capsaspora owczarzaki ATCC 30864]
MQLVRLLLRACAAAVPLAVSLYLLYLLSVPPSFADNDAVGVRIQPPSHESLDMLLQRNNVDAPTHANHLQQPMSIHEEQQQQQQQQRRSVVNPAAAAAAEDKIVVGHRPLEAQHPPRRFEDERKQVFQQKAQRAQAALAAAVAAVPAAPNAAAHAARPDNKQLDEHSPVAVAARSQQRVGLALDPKDTMAQLERLTKAAAALGNRPSLSDTEQVMLSADD